MSGNNRGGDAVLIGVNRHSDVGQDKAGRGVTLLAFTPEQTETLIGALTNAQSQTGTLIRIATEMKSTNDGSRQFPSSFLMVMEDKPREGSGGGYQKKDKFKPSTKTYGNSAPASNGNTYKKTYGKPAHKQQTRLVEEDQE